MGKWLEDYAEANVGPAAYERYAGAVRNHITPRLGAIPLADLRPEQLVAAMRHWHTAGRIDGRGGLAPASVHSIYKVLHEALERAVRWPPAGRQSSEGGGSTTVHPAGVCGARHHQTC